MQRWPSPAPRLYLLDASSRFEERLLAAWVESRTEGHAALRDAVPIPPSRRRRRRVGLSPLEVALAGDDDPELIPLRVAWMPKLRDGERAGASPTSCAWVTPATRAHFANAGSTAAKMSAAT